MELDIPGFFEEYAAFEGLEDSFFERLRNNVQERTEEQNRNIEGEYRNLDVKMRLAFGITEIQLGPLFVDKKYGPLRECHLLYYKLADLWFAYETYITFLSKILGIKKPHKVDWVGQPAYVLFSHQPLVGPALAAANAGLQEEFGAERRSALSGYLRYCEQAAESKGQKTKLQAILRAYEEGNSLSVAEMLALAYAIRNNFVHNGETTVVPRGFSFENKWRLLRIVYRFLAICLLTWVNQAMRAV
jgi:hypothetical protein